MAASAQRKIPWVAKNLSVVQRILQARLAGGWPGPRFMDVRSSPTPAADWTVLHDLASLLICQVERWHHDVKSTFF